MNLELKNRITKCLDWSVALYAAETWILTQTDRQKIRSLQNVDMEKNVKDQLA